MLASLLWLLLVPGDVSAFRCRCAFQDAPAAASVGALVAGVVRDQSGGVLPGLVVLVRSASGRERQAVTGSEGQFSVLSFAPEPSELIVRVAGFAEFRQVLPTELTPARVDVVLAPASAREEITVAGTRSAQLASNVPNSTVLLSRADLHATPAIVADDALRQVPTFSLFRRTGSIAAHPATQGVSLRGIGPSAASRTLVLLDGVPLNDPFGGWIAWSRVPIAALDRVEVVEGATSNLYGNYAMGGVISLETQPAAPRTMQVQAGIGTRETPSFSVGASDLWGRVGVSADANIFDTAGYPTVIDSERGGIDDNSTVGFSNVNARVEYAANDRVRAFGRVGHFRERRDNGKHTTFTPRTEETNDTQWTSASGGVGLHLPDLSDVQLSVFVDDERFRTNAVAVVDSVTRDEARLAFDQTVPSTGWGGMLQWTRPLAAVHLFTGGLDWRIVDGESHELVFDDASGTEVVRERFAGGHQRSVGMFFQDLITPSPRLTLTLSARLDRYQNAGGHALEYDLAHGGQTQASLPTVDDRTDVVGSPRAALLVHITRRVAAWGAAAAGFRAPTLNELYRGFRVGTRQVIANPQLGPERMVGGEGGVMVELGRQVAWRATLFDTHLRNPVSNVTITQSGADVTLLRKNLGRTRATGFDANLDYRPKPAWRITGAYAYTVSKVVEYDPPVMDADPADQVEGSLVGKYVPQVPRHRGSVMAVYSGTNLQVSASLEAVSTQYDDDRNVSGVPGHHEAGLPGYAVVNVLASRRLGHEFEIFVNAQNLLNQEYYVATLPTLVGTPRLVLAGVRFTLRGK